MKRKKVTAGLLIVGFMAGFSASHLGILTPADVNAAVQHFYFNSVRIGLAQPPMRDFFATGDIITSRRTFTTEVLAGGMTENNVTSAGRIRLRDEQARELIDMKASDDDGGSIQVKGPDGNTTVAINGGPSGGSIQLNGRGLDFAEMFELREANKLEPGHVVVIDSDKAGRLKMSTQANERGVVGVIAGAGGLHSGIVLGPRPDDSHKPVALSGRVYTCVDASYGSVKPGDMLTTSPTPGYAMRITDASQAHGAIIGKAMESLDHGRGKILILVNLQ
jgi:hypothetical protein